MILVGVVLAGAGTGRARLVGAVEELARERAVRVLPQQQALLGLRDGVGEAVRAAGASAA